MFVNILLTSFLVGYASSFQKCDLPPSLWCSTVETAHRCKVLEQCKEFYTVKKDATLVNVTLYHESLCPDCVNFITTELWKAFTTVPNIFTITMVPYGNAMEKKEPSGLYQFMCQHGKQECVGNIIESCAIYVLKNEAKSFTYSHCIAKYLETEKTENITKGAEKCAKEQNIDFEQIHSCANSQLGNQLEHQMALQTNALNPQHQYVPWVTINGIHTEEIQKKAEKNLVKLICDTFQGSKPSTCQEKYQHKTCLKKEL